ncbi:MAG: HEPN domain-containing protein [Acidobacteria bacterium]|nr:HEPN domain-containing protein [Acidobacteriota bacterium]
MKTEAQRWLEFAREDIQMADWALSQDIYRQTCFHSQKAVEKALKGLLVARKGTYPKSHSLEALLLAYPDLDSELLPWSDRCRNLDRFYIPTRYPDALPGSLPTGEPTQKDAQEALQDAKALVNEIQQKLVGEK